MVLKFLFQISFYLNNWLLPTLLMPQIFLLSTYTICQITSIHLYVFQIFVKLTLCTLPCLLSPKGSGVQDGGAAEGKNSHRHRDSQDHPKNSPSSIPRLHQDLQVWTLEGVKVPFYKMDGGALTSTCVFLITIISLCDLQP